MKEEHKAVVKECIQTDTELRKMTAAMNVHPSKEYADKLREDKCTKAIMDLDHLEDAEARVIAKEIIAMEDDEDGV